MNEGKKLPADYIIEGKSYEEYVADVGRGPDTLGRMEFQFLVALDKAIEKMKEERKNDQQ